MTENTKQNIFHEDDTRNLTTSKQTKATQSIENEKSHKLAVDFSLGATPLTVTATSTGEKKFLAAKVENETGNEAEAKPVINPVKIYVIERIIPEPARIPSGKTKEKYRNRGFSSDISTMKKILKRAETALNSATVKTDILKNAVKASKIALYKSQYDLAPDILENELLVNVDGSKKAETIDDVLELVAKEELGISILGELKSDFSENADTVYLHYTGQHLSGTGIASVKSLTGNTGQDSYVSSHFVLLRNGRLIQLFDFDKTTYTQGFGEEYDMRSDLKSVVARDIYDANDNKVDPNSYSYSIECASSGKESGGLSYKQKNSIIHAIKYIRKEVNDRYDVKIKFNRYWDGFPYMPTPSNELEIGSGYVEDDGTAQKTRTVDFGDVFGHLLGHNDSKATLCPGYLFPWQFILSGLGVYPDETDEIYSRDETFFENVFTHLHDVNKSFYSQYQKYKEGSLKTMPNIPWYDNPYYQEEEVIYLVWERPLESICEESTYNNISDKHTFVKSKGYKEGEYILIP